MNQKRIKAVTGHELYQEPGYMSEPKPDEDRLLTKQEAEIAINPTLGLVKRIFGTKENLTGRDAYLVKGQDAKTASMKDAECQQNIIEVGKQLRNYQKTGFVWSAELERITKQCEQALKEREGVK